MRRARLFPNAPLSPPDKHCPMTGDQQRAFTLIELLVVMAVIVILMAMVVPAFTTGSSAQNVTTAAYDMAGALNEARAYAMANNTYVWVGFYEESAAQASTTPATSGMGRIVLSIVASKDGTMIYNPPNSLPIASGSMTMGLTQVNKLVKIDNMHLKTFPIPTAGVTFLTRPAVSGTGAQIGDATDAGGSQAPFQYPVGNPAPRAQYVFRTAIQFSPSGVARLNDMSQPLQTVMEIGLQPTHGTVVAANSQNVAVVQLTGISGNVEIYKP